MESPAVEMILRAICLAAKAVQQNLLLVMDDDVILPQDGRKRPRPRHVWNAVCTSLEGFSLLKTVSQAHCFTISPAY